MLQVVKRRRVIASGRLVPAPTAPREAPELPAWKAFVVQFTRDTAPKRGTFAGRAEHLSSGRRARFKSPEELVAILGKLLDELGEDCAPPKRVDGAPGR